MAKMRAKAIKSTRVSWKSKSEGHQGQVNYLEGYIKNRDVRLQAAIDANKRLDQRNAELEEKATSVGLQNRDLREANLALDGDVRNLSATASRLEADKLRLELKVCELQRLSDVLAILHLAGKSLEDCLYEFREIADWVGVKSHQIPNTHVSEAYKEASQRIHQLLFEQGVRVYDIIRSAKVMGGVQEDAKK